MARRRRSASTRRASSSRPIDAFQKLRKRRAPTYARRVICMNILLAAPLCFAAFVTGVTGARADDADFFAGKNVTVMIGYAAGGTYDATARLLSRHMGRHIAGNPNFLPQNLPGSGGIKAILNLYSVAPRDGTALGMLARSYAIEPA